MRVLLMASVLFCLWQISGAAAHSTVTTASDGSKYQLRFVPEPGVAQLDLGERRKVAELCTTNPLSTGIWHTTTTCLWQSEIRATAEGIVEVAVKGSVSETSRRTDRIALLFTALFLLLGCLSMKRQPVGRLSYTSLSIICLIIATMSALVGLVGRDDDALFFGMVVVGVVTKYGIPEDIEDISAKWFYFYAGVCLIFTGAVFVWG